MIDIPEELARAIKSGDCVLWVGAGFGALAGRPGWDSLLGRLVERCPEDARESLTELLEQGRLRTVLTYVHRHLGDEPLAKLLEEVSGDEATAGVDEGADRLVRLPWKACFATTYADVVQRIFSDAERKPEVVTHTSVHYLSLRDQEDFFILRTPPTGRAMRADAVLFDLVEEVVRTRTILFLGFEPDDPDLAQIFDLLDRIGRGNKHFALMPLVSAPEAEEILDRFNLDVVDVPEDTRPVSLLDDLLAACDKATVRPSDAAGQLATLDLTRAVRGLALRADLAIDDALTLDLEWIEHLVEALPGSLAKVPPATLLRAGGLMLAHGRAEGARKLFQQVVSGSAGREFTNLSRFNLALTAVSEGDLEAALESFVACAEADRSLALVPPRFELRAINGRSGTQLWLTCRDRESKEDFDIGVATLGRPVGGEEQATFHRAVHELREVEHPTVAMARGGFADGRLFGVMSASTPGFVLVDTLDEPMPVEKAFELYGPLSEGLEACHARSVLHRNVNPQNIVVGPDGPVLRGFGFAPIVGFTRPAVREDNEGYMSPEAWSRGEVTASSDAYALAAVLYRCLTGQPPRGSVPPPTTLREELDPRLDPLLQAALHPDPAKRLPLKEVREQLAHIVETPGLGDAQRIETQPGEERVVEVGTTRAGAGASTVEMQTSGGGGAAPSVADEAISAPVSVKIVLPDDPDDLESWAWILERKPAHIEAREAVDRIDREAREQGRWDRVAEVLGVRAQHAQVQQERVAFLRELVELFETKLGAPANAFESLQNLIEEVGVDEQVVLTGDLSRLAEITGQWSQLADSLLIVAERATEADAQARLYSELGRVYAEKLGATDRAIASLEKAIDIQPTEDRLQAVVPLHRRIGHHAELAAALLSLADLQDGEDRQASLFAAAKVLRGELGDEEGAYGILEIILADGPSHAEALEMGESLARTLERWDGLIDILGRRADALLDADEATALRREAAQLALQHLEDRNTAIEELTKVVEADRHDRESAQDLVELLRGAVRQDVGRRPALIDALNLLVELVEVPDERAVLLAESAELLDQEPDGRDRAADCRERILELLPPDREPASAAAESLERRYRRQEAWTQLLDMLLRQGKADDADEAFRARAWEKVLEVRRGPLDDGEGAIEALEALTRLEPQETRWRDDLLEQYIERKEFEKAGPLIRAQVFDEKDPRRKAELLLRGGILREQIGKMEGAFEALEEAVSLEPSLVEAWLALRDAYDHSEQPLKALEAQVSAAENHTNRVERVRLFFEAARRYLEEVDRPERAMELLEKVAELDPDHREATGLLLEHLVAAGDLARTWPHAQTYVMQVKSQAPNDHQLNLRALSVAGRCALAVEEKEKARGYLEKAKSLDATNLDVLRLLGDLDLEAERFEEALRNYQSVVLGVGDKLAPGELSRLYVRMCEARVGVGEKGKAVQMAERAHDIDPDNERALEALIDLAPEVGGASALVKAKQRMEQLLARRETRTDGEEARAEIVARRVALLQEIAAAQIDDLKLPDEAVGTLEKVLQLTPDDPAVLHRILDVFTEEKRWRDALNVLKRLAEAQSEDAARAKYLYAGATIMREYLPDDAGVLEWLERTIAADPLHPRAFEVYIEQLESQQAWDALSKAIRARLKAMAELEPGRRHVELFEKLGEVYERKSDGKTALAAYDQAARIAAKLGEEDEDEQKDRRLKVMKLAVQLGEDELDKAIDHGHALIAAKPMEFEVYHRLVELYLKQGSRDQARALSRTLRFLKQADEAELDLADSGGGAGQVHRSVSREQWRHGVYHPLEDPKLSDLFSMVWPMIAAREGRTHAHHSVSRSDRVEVALQSPNALARFLAHACQIFDAPIPDLYLREEEAGGIVIDALADKDSKTAKMVYPSVLAGKAALGDTSEPAMKFRAGRAVARARPEHVLASVLPSATALRHAVYGVIRVTHPEALIPGDAESASAGYAGSIQGYLQPSRLEQLGILAQRVAEHGEIDCRRWVQGVAYTTTRAGFLLCDSIETAAQILTRESDEGSPIPAKERIRDLIAYSVSEPYLHLRKALGLGR